MNTYENILAESNPSQYQAATFEKKHCMVIAGAGCGKTKTIIARSIYLISQGIPAERIQILSFTRRSASEIYERVRLTIGEDSVKGLHTSTFHTWCLSLIRSNSKLFEKESFNILDSDDQIQLFRLYRGRHAKGTFPSADKIAELYSFTRNTKSSLSKTYDKFFPEFIAQKEKVVEIMKSYEQKKLENQYIDYDDILEFISSALNQYPDFAEHIGKQYDYILVDEMQDTNPLQWTILQPLSKYCKLFCVGDDAQSIYGFRGADYKNVHSFNERLFDSEILKLEDNYRSTQEILDFSNWLLSKSTINYQKQLKAIRGKGKKPQLHDFDNDWEESRFIIETIIKNKNEGRKYSDHLILVRSGAFSKKIEVALIQQNIPYVFTGGFKFMESSHIKDILSLLRIAVNNKDEISWMRFLCLWPGIGEISASNLTEQVITEKNVLTAIKKLSTIKENDKIPNELLTSIRDVVTTSMDTKKSVKVAIKKLYPILEKKYINNEWEKRKVDFDYLIKLSEKFSTLQDFIDDCIIDPIQEAFSIGKNELDDRVRISTIHTAKGTENSICFVTNVSVGIYPNSKIIDSLEEIEEERRVLYVALTRAKNELIVTRINKASFVFDSKSSTNKLDMYFFNELPSSLVEKIDHKKHDELPASLKNGKPLNIKVGIDFS